MTDYATREELEAAVMQIHAEIAHDRKRITMIHEYQGMLMNSGYVTSGEFEERIAFLLEEWSEDIKRIYALEKQIEELYHMIAKNQTESRNRANQIYANLKTRGTMTRAEVSTLLDDLHPQSTLRAMQECEALHTDVSIQRDQRGRIRIYRNAEASDVLF